MLGMYDRLLMLELLRPCGRFAPHHPLYGTRCWARMWCSSATESLHFGVQVLADEWIQAARTGRNWRHLKVWMGVSRSTHGGNKSSQA